MALFSGEPNSKNLHAKRIVPTLSSLVILAIKGWLNSLDQLKTKMVSPSSFKEFVKNQLMAEIDYQQVSPGFLIGRDDGSISFVERKKQDSDIWQKIWDWCKGVDVIPVSEIERASFIIGGNTTWERAFSNSHLNDIQLDSFIIAKKESAVYLSDDLFFRRIATLLNVPSVNFATILLLFDLDISMPIIIELAETNYIYTPILFRNIEEKKNLFTHLLNGKEKKKYYQGIIDEYENTTEEGK